MAVVVNWTFLQSSRELRIIEPIIQYCKNLLGRDGGDKMHGHHDLPRATCSVCALLVKPASCVFD